MYKLKDQVTSKKTGKEGIIQASYSNGDFLVFNGEFYEHLKKEDMELSNKQGE